MTGEKEIRSKGGDADRLLSAGQGPPKEAGAEELAGTSRIFAAEPTEVAPRRPASRQAVYDPVELSVCPIVGIGASAGGLEAMEDFFDKVSVPSGLAFVIVQHLAPQHTSVLPDILSRHTSLGVQLAEDGAIVRPENVYVIPPNTALTIKDGRLEVREPIDRRRTPIDTFFRSLAEDQQENAICIVLSGAGTDGSLGLKAVKEHTGMTMAQAPETARYESMPRSAINLGLVDFVLSPAEMPAKLAEYARTLQKAAGTGAGRALQQEDVAELLRKICAALLRRTGHDFSQYKAATLVRRIHRRMQVVQVATFAAYLGLLRGDPSEVDLLFRDLLIRVTHFFRDPDVFSALATQVVPYLFHGKGDATQDVRVWVPGCATGEEAYSIAILLREHLSKVDMAPRIKIFATDIDDQALEVARTGRYPEGIAERVSQDRLERFFLKQGGFYQVDKQVREMCIFSTHNIIRDPPFSRLDLIACRNLLIYLEGAVQKRLVPLFHYALRSSGYLLLGPSESLAAHPQLFRTVDKTSRIFRRNDAVISPAWTFPVIEAGRGRLTTDTPVRHPAVRERGLAKVFERVLLDAYAPAAGLPGPKVPSLAGIVRPQDPLAEALAAELRSTKVHLQTTIEELETTNEELKSANEEMLSTNEELQSSNEELQTLKEEADKRKNELLAVLSHELRNPLVPVRNAIWIMKKSLNGSSRTELSRAVKLVDRQIEQLSRRIDDLLDVSRIAAGKVAILKRPFDLVALARSILDDLRPSAEEAKIVLKQSLPNEVVVVNGDEPRFVQAIGNLLRNGLKLSEKGGQVELALEIEENTAVLCVRDRGVGIDEQTLKGMFEPFEQGKRANERGGLGLGLSLAKRMVELHGGSLTGESAGPGRGAVFTIRLPIARELEPLVDRTEESTNQGDSSGKGERRVLQVLLIEDDYDVADGMSMLLEDEGCTVTIASSGEEGVRLAKSERPDVVLCDIGLPGNMNGYDVVMALRADPETAGLYCIALSGYGQKEDKLRAIEAGFNAHLTKPADPDELLQLFRSAPMRSKES